MRKLIYVPIIHTEADMGSMAKMLKNEFKKETTQQSWQAHIKAIDEMWRGIAEKIAQLKLSWSKVKIYQDGLPVCGKELEIVTDIAKTGSINHKIVLDLVNRGAKLEGTEQGKLLLQEYEYLQKIERAKNTAQKNVMIKEYNTAAKALLRQRDKFIASRIDQTILEEETGILFMGMMHEVDRFLPGDISVSFLIHRLPFSSYSSPRRFAGTS